MSKSNCFHIETATSKTKDMQFVKTTSNRFLILFKFIELIENLILITALFKIEKVIFF